MGIAVLDSLVVGEGCYHSMADKCELGLGFDKPAASVVPMPPQSAAKKEREIIKALREAGPEATKELLNILEAAVRAKKKARGRREKTAKKSHEDAPGEAIGNVGETRSSH